MGDSYSEPVTNLIPGTHDKEISQVFKIIDKYTSDERIQEMIHELDTQICEAINNALTYLAPKNKNFCRTRTYEYRKAHVISMQNDCAHAWFLAVFAELGLQMSTSMEQFILSLDKTKTQGQEKQASLEDLISLIIFCSFSIFKFLILPSTASSILSLTYLKKHKY